jgi:anti-sigma regulatory factor (Ser/Thr protein kinase)
VQAGRQLDAGCPVAGFVRGVQYDRGPADEKGVTVAIPRSSVRAVPRAPAGTPWRQEAPPLPVSGCAPLGEWALSGPSAVTSARKALGSTLAAVSSDDDVERLLLTFEELASNAVRHGRGPVRARVSPVASGWLIDVTDGDVDHPPTPAVDRDPAQGGMGLHLIARLCPSHGWTVAADGKHVWACVRRSAD